MNYDAIVVGGGIVGASAAYHLVRGGARTLLLDRGDAGQASAAGAGIVTPETAAEPDVWYRFARAAVEYYPPLVEMLAADGAGDTGYARSGLLVMAVSEDEDAAFHQASERIFARQAEYSYPEPDDIRQVDAAEARQLFPALEDIRGAIYSRVAGRMDGRLMTSALLEAAKGRGLEIRLVGVDQLDIGDSTVRGVVADGATIPAGAVVLASGAWSGSFAKQLGVRIPIEPVRGQIIHLKLDDPTTGDWPIITAFHGHYLVPWPDGRVVVGATFEPSSGFAPHTTAAGIHKILGEALRVAPGLTEATIADIRVGLRPFTPDRLPILGPVPALGNIYIAAGHAGTGLQLGPYSGKLIADLITTGNSEADLTPFSISRFI